MNNPVFIWQNGQRIKATPQAVLEYQIKRARRDPLYFGKFIFGHEPATHHREFFDAVKNHDRILLVWPREFGKTMSVITLMAWYIGHFPHRTNVITSVSSEQAKKRLANLKEIIEKNPYYQLVFPWVKPDPQKPWTETEINVTDDRVSYTEFWNKRKEAGNTASVYAAGVGGKGLVGNRITGLAVVDDPHDEDAAFSPTKRERGITWYFRTFINCLRPGAKAIVITTR